jgi:TonB family protein
MSFTPLKSKTSIGFCVAASAVAHLVFMVIAYQAPALAPEAFTASDDACATVQIAAYEPILIEDAVLPQAWTTTAPQTVEVAQLELAQLSGLPAAEAPAAESARAQRTLTPTDASASREQRAASAATVAPVVATREGNGATEEIEQMAAQSGMQGPEQVKTLATASTESAGSPLRAPQDTRAAADTASATTVDSASPELHGDDSHRQLVARYAGRVRNVLGAPPVTSEIRQQHATGTVLVRLLVDERGRVIGLEVIDSSGDALLDANTIAWLQDRRLPRPPRGLRGAPVAFAVPVTYATA